EQRDEEARAREERARERERDRERGRERSDRRAEERDRYRADRSGNRGSQNFPGANEFSVGIGFQAGFAGTLENPSAFKLFLEYAHRLSDLVWLDVQANNVFGVGPSNNVCYDPMGNPFPCGGFYYGGWVFEPAIGVKFKIATRSPLVVEIPLL